MRIRIPLNRVNRAVGRRSVSRRIWRSPVTWLMLMGVTALLVAACGGGNGSSGHTFHDMLDADESRKVQDFELVVFGNENYAKGEQVRLSQFLGQPVVVNFWFPSCGPCRAEMPDLEKAFNAHKEDEVAFMGVQLLGLDTAEDGQVFIDEIGITYAVGPDDGTDIVRDEDYEVISFPTTFFLDREHKIVRKWVGILTPGKLEELIQKLL